MKIYFCSGKLGESGPWPMDSGQSWPTKDTWPWLAEDLPGARDGGRFWT
jgi:hypothetical protein